ncbi:excalibur calcium-binding domain-containing protein [Roseomonas sp. SSH11]|uniref:Excalibur calcium-binding domain-containing protein n=1 Tax=Pararoseomonas baculiformis TaxID=2820812 RepID=A0ABS4A9K1_9PROT|nr:excalibur calcium-binding domain-containing protein [Pararoseomonas baculiformis]
MAYAPSPATPQAWMGHGGQGASTLSLEARHRMAARSCDTARAVGLAPARRGEPGYWPHLDADDDGIACEPWPYRGWR